MSAGLFRRLWVFAPTAAILLIASPAAAAPGHYASNGERCTIVGTGKADVLKGTRGKDVICGRGGNDTIRGAGGNDVLDGGSGRDRLAGDAGNDRVYGGGGDDTQNGGAGRDALVGGRGSDVLVGGGDPDTLKGDSGNDDLNGQAGKDTLDGGDGTNWCTIGSGDVQSRCVYDRTAPVLKQIVVNPATVDVTTKARTFTVRMHVVDDTGVVAVSASTDAGRIDGAKLVSGDVRDGWWEATGVVERYQKPGSWGVSAWYQDRIGRQACCTPAATLTVRDANPDTTAPAVTGLTMSRTSVDVRTGDATVTVTANVADDRSGIFGLDLALMTPANDYNGAGAHGYFTRVSGENRSAKYRAQVTIPRGSTGGRWNVSISTIDRVGNIARYIGPEMYALKKQETYNNYRPLSSGARLDVAGTVLDTSKPVLQGVVVDRTEVDTLPRSATVTFDVTAADAGDGIGQVTVSLVDHSTWLELQGHAYQPYAGTARSGVWRVTVTLPQGTPPGQYVVDSIHLFDRNNWGLYGTPASVGFTNGSVLAPEHYRTVGGSPWDGAITVVQNPAG